MQYARRGQSLPKGGVVRHSKIDHRMAEMGQTLPSRDFCGTAALPLKPDIGWRGWRPILFGLQIVMTALAAASCFAARADLWISCAGNSENCFRRSVISQLSKPNPAVPLGVGDG
jgi:hypothetical protein